MDSMDNCKKCNCDCHCIVSEHSEAKGICNCQSCECAKSKAQDLTYKYAGAENGGLVIDDTGECESCQ